MYVVDMYHGFRKMKELLHTGSFEQRFTEVFKKPAPKVNTYHDQVRKWKNAPSPLREAALSAGRTSAGHWALFSRSVPLKKK